MLSEKKKHYIGSISEIALGIAVFAASVFNSVYKDMSFNGKLGGDYSNLLPPSENVSEKNFPVNINTATFRELRQIKGFGAKKAGAVISYREEHGDFQSVDELLNVSGIGEKTLEKIRDIIVCR